MAADRTLGAAQPTASAGAPAVVVERPPPGLGRGQYAAPPWVIGLVGGTVALVGLGWTLWRWRRARRAR